MRKLTILSLALAVIIFPIKILLAAGIGGYFNAGYGKYQYSRGASFSSSNLVIGGGLITDTNLSKDSLFNYRMKLGYSKFRCDMSNRVTMHNIHFVNIFGIGAVRTEYVRFWLGPQIGINYTSSKNSHTFFKGFWYKQNKYLAGGADIGLTLGININPGDYVTISIDGGATYGFMGGIVKETRMIVDPSTPGVVPLGTVEKGILAHGYELHASISILYRINDTYFSAPD